MRDRGTAERASGGWHGEEWAQRAEGLVVSYLMAPIRREGHVFVVVTRASIGTGFCSVKGGTL